MLALDLTSGLEDAWSNVASFVPKLVGALAVLLIGWIIAKMVRKVVNKVLDKINFDKWVDKSGLGAPLSRAGYHNSGHLLGTLVYFAIMIIVLQLAIGVFGVTSIQQAFDGMLAFIPRLFIALILVVLTGVVANAVRSMIQPALANLSYGPLVSKIAFAAIWVIGGFAAFDQLQIANDIVTTLFDTIVYSLGLILVIKFGVGGIWAARDRFWPSVYDAVSTGDKGKHSRKSD